MIILTGAFADENSCLAENEMLDHLAWNISAFE